jgi:hypothetical protein
MGAVERILFSVGQLAKIVINASTRQPYRADATEPRPRAAVLILRGMSENTAISGPYRSNATALQHRSIAARSESSWAMEDGGGPMGAWAVCFVSEN